MAKKKSRTATKEPTPAAPDNAQPAVPSAGDIPAETAASSAATAAAPETSQAVTEPAPLPPILQEKAGGEPTPPGSQQALFADGEQASHAYVQAPPRGRAGAITIDNRLGYRKETVDRGSKRQIRFADREGGQRPEDELLAPLRETKPVVEYRATEKAWQAQNDAVGRHALDLADQRLRDISHKRRQGPER